MRICFIGDAAAIHTQRWVRWFAADHEVFVISTTAADSMPEYEVAQLPIETAPGLRLLRSLRMVRQVLAAYQPDLLHSHYINEAGWFGAASRRRPLVVTAWGSDVYRAPVESRLARHLNRWSVRSADWVTCDSADQAAVICSWGVPHERVSVIGWGIDRREFHPGIDGTPLRERLDIPWDAPVLLSPRQWLPNSNIAAVIAAHERLPASVYLVLKRGSQPDDGADVQTAIAASRAHGRIRVLGEITENQLPVMYASADVVVSLCTTDGTPASVLEAMALGKPVVALQNASLAEWVSDPGGRLVPGLDPEVIADAVLPLLFDRDVRARAAAHNLSVVAKRADRQVEFGRMARIYERLTESPHGTR